MSDPNYGPIPGHVPTPQREAARKSRWPWIAGGAALLAIGVGIGASGDSEPVVAAPAVAPRPVSVTPESDPTPSPTPTPTPSPSPSVEEMSDRDVAVLALTLTLGASEDRDVLCDGYALYGPEYTTYALNEGLTPANRFAQDVVIEAFEEVC